MEADCGRPARVATFALMGLAYATCEVAAYPDGRPRPFGVAFGVALFAAALGVNALVRRPAPGARPSRRLTLLLTLALGLPVAAEPLVREWAGEGVPLELQLVNGLRVLGLALAGVAAWPRSRRLAGVVALFLALFASAMGDQPAIPYLLGAFAAAGGLWLMLDHRAGQPGAATGVAADAAGRVALRLPYREALVFLALAAAAGAVAVAGPKRVTLALGELLPTSGGTGATDPFARSGVGDGPEEVAGDNARAAGMVETDQMIEDTKDALIDVVSDMYGEARKPPKEKERDRMVAAGLARVIQNHEKLPDNRRPSCPFDTARQGPKAGRKPDGQGPRGVFEVEGRTPLHVRLVAYDRYDPAGGRWDEARKPSSILLEPDGGDWMRVTGPGGTPGDWYAAYDRHRLKAADLRRNLVPTPTLLARVRISKVNKPDYYERDYDGVYALAGRKKTPPGVVVTTDCRTVDPARLPAAAFAAPWPGSAAPPAAGEVPAAIAPAIDRIAREWAGDAPPGWPRVEAVLDRLRRNYTLDRGATAPEGHPAPALWFLTESRRGPDYLFATSAALLLRSLGHPSRVCLGYYAAPESYDPETEHTPVKTADLHVWPEVLLADGQWLVVEPTPGYAVLPPLLPWRERVGAVVAQVAARAGRNAVELAAAALLTGLLVWRRKTLADRLVTLAWRLAPGRTWQAATLRAVRVLERRSRSVGRPRAASQTLHGWAESAGGGDDRLAELVRLAEWAAYGPARPPVPEADVPGVCRRALVTWPAKRFAARATAGKGGAA